MVVVSCRQVPGNIYKHKFGNNFDQNTNELVIRIQPKESIYMRINNKVRCNACNVPDACLSMHEPASLLRALLAAAGTPPVYTHS